MLKAALSTISKPGGNPNALLWVNAEANYGIAIQWILLCKKKDWTTGTSNNLGESDNHYAK